MWSEIYRLFCDDCIANFNKKASFFILFKTKARFFLFYRLSNSLFKKRASLHLKILFKLADLYYVHLQKYYDCEIPSRTEIGTSLILPHLHGIIINPEAIVGDFCTILHQVTVGNNPRKGVNNLAIIGSHVHIGAGAKIIGPCRIGSYAHIGANAVVVKNVSDNEIVGGVPAVNLGFNK